MTSLEDRNEMQFVFFIIYKDPVDSYYRIRYFIKMILHHRMRLQIKPYIYRKARENMNSRIREEIRQGVN